MGRNERVHTTQTITFLFFERPTHENAVGLKRNNRVRRVLLPSIYNWRISGFPVQSDLIKGAQRHFLMDQSHMAR